MKRAVRSIANLSRYDMYKFRMRHNEERDILSFDEYINHEVERRIEERERRDAWKNEPLTPANTVFVIVTYVVPIIVWTYFVANGTLMEQIKCLLFIGLFDFIFALVFGIIKGLKG